MKEYVLVMRINPNALTPAQITDVREKWAILVKEWKEKKIYVEGNQVIADGLVVKKAGIEQGAVFSDGTRVVSFITLLANSMQEAAAWAQKTPLLLYGGSAEVRLLQRAAAATPAPATN
ncbi:YciI family protein [Deminuibacter soli]|nr:hypothetical protein [Deminuibacter soli]